MRVQVAPTVFLAITVTGLVFAADETKPKQDLSTMSPDEHAVLFRAPKANAAGAVTERITSGLPKPAAHAGKMPRRNFIDEHIFGRMEREGIPYAPISTDQEFFRRVTLDLTGRIPSPAGTREFLADHSPDKRAKLIDQLIGSPGFVDKWAYFYMDLVRANGKMSRGVNLFHLMLKDSLAADRPYDDLARSMIAASAKSNYVVAAVNPIVREHVEGKPGENDDPDDLRKVHQMDTHDEVSILFGKVFLGINLSCIACHDGKSHLEKVNVYLSGKKRSDFFQESSFFGHARYIAHIEHREAIMGHFSVDDASPGYDTKGDSMLRIKRFGGPNAPKFILTNELAKPGAEPREELGRMLTSHPQFARATANMFWAKLMGIGLVEPFDEFDLARLDPKNVPAGWEVQPSNPELLEAMADYFRKNNYSLHKLFSVICNSNAYQLSARFPGEWNDKYTKYYARKFARMLTAEELHDAIALATERPGKFGGASKKKVVNADDPPPTASVSMAMQVSVPRAGGELKSFLQAFGQANRGTPARPPQPSPMQPIMLMRSSVVNDRVIAANDSRVQRLLDSYKDDGKVVDELFMSALSREPSQEEKALGVSVMAKNRVEGAQNIEWALLNLVEFLYNF
jgi:hypothetical protein